MEWVAGASPVPVCDPGLQPGRESGGEGISDLDGDRSCMLGSELPILPQIAVCRLNELQSHNPIPAPLWPRLDPLSWAVESC